MLRNLASPRSWSQRFDPSHDAPAAQWRINPSLLAIAAVASLFVAAYANSWRNSFHFDDAHVVETNPAIRSLSNIPRFFTDARTFSSLPTNQTYRPIVTLTLAIDHATARAATGTGFDQRAFHFTQLALLVLVAALLGGVARQLYTEAARDDAELADWTTGAAVVAAGLFAVHVANTEVGNYISARSESLSAAGVLAALYLYLRGGVWRRSHLYLVPMALGALSKTPAVLFAPLLVIWSIVSEESVDAGHLRTSAAAGASMRRAFLRALPAFIAAVALYSLIEGMNPPEQTYGNGGRLQNLWTQLWVAVRYVGMFFVPSSLTADSDWSVLASPWDGRVLTGVALLVLSAWATWWAARTRVTRPIAFGIAWFWIGLLPSAAVPLAEVTNDHRPFLAFVGLTMAVVWGGALLVRRATDRTLAAPCAIGLSALMLALHAVGTHARNRVWASEATLWADVVRTSPGNARGLMNFALTAMRGARYTEARALLDSASRLAPGYPLIYVNMAIAADAQGDTTAAASSFRRAITIDPRNADARRYYARWLTTHGHAPDALVEYARAVSARPADVDARRERLVLLAATGSRVESTREARAMLSLDATDSVAQAIAMGQPSVTPTPDSTPLGRLSDRWFRAGWALTLAGRHAEAVQAYREAVSTDSSNANALTNLGWSLGVLGFFDLAAPPLERAVVVAPTSTRARNNLAWVRTMQARAGTSAPVMR